VRQRRVGHDFLDGADAGTGSPVGRDGKHESQERGVLGSRTANCWHGRKSSRLCRNDGYALALELRCRSALPEALPPVGKPPQRLADDLNVGARLRKFLGDGVVLGSKKNDSPLCPGSDPPIS
jgi:hypothetical protein